jgi:amino acid transporter
VILSLFAYLLAAGALIRLLPKLPGRRQRWAAGLTAILGIACALTMIASADRAELLWSLAPLPIGAVLYLLLGRR